MGIILDWVKRIIRIGIMEFLSKIGLKAALMVVGTFAGAIVLIVVLLAVLIMLLL